MAIRPFLLETYPVSFLGNMPGIPHCFRVVCLGNDARLPSLIFFSRRAVVLKKGWHEWLCKGVGMTRSVQS